VMEQSTDTAAQVREGMEEASADGSTTTADGDAPGTDGSSPPA
jgi:hypothetical protein